MGKLEKFRMNGLGNAAESMGAGVPGRTAPGSALHGATAVGSAAVPVQLQGVSRNKDAAHIPQHSVILTHCARLVSDLAGHDPNASLFRGDTLPRASPSRHCL